jgi:hypothetical protein
MNTHRRLELALASGGIMKRLLAPILVAAFISASGAGAFAAGPDLPIVKGKKAVATVNGEPISAEEYNRELASLPAGDAAQKDELLRRFINARLIVQEGKRAGLNELAEIKQRVEVFSKVTLREELMERHVRNIKPDPKEVDRLYKQSVKEWKLSSGLFEEEEAAKKFEKAAKEGKDFEITLRSLISDGKVKEGEFGKYVKNRELAPEIATALGTLKVGEISPVIRLQTGFAVLRLEEVRYPENKAAKEKAMQEALSRKQKEALVKYDQELKKKYAKIHKKVLDELDLEAKEPGFQALLKDKRIVAEIQGEKPITVGELTDYIRQQLYHGVDGAIESKTVNKRKAEALEEMIHKRVFIKEALRLGIDKTSGYKTKVKEQEDSLVFGAYVQKAVVPEIKLQEQELESYYKEHLREYTYPEMIRMNDLVFGKRKNAEEVIEKLRKGAEFKWLAEHSQDQIAKDSPGIMNFEGKVMTVQDLPSDVQKVVSGAKPGDVRLYESSKGHFYVLVVQEAVPSKIQPYTEVREEIAKKVYNEKVKKAVENLADRLRAMSDVKIYLKVRN